MSKNKPLIACWGIELVDAVKHDASMIALLKSAMQEAGDADNRIAELEGREAKLREACLILLESHSCRLCDEAEIPEKISAHFGIRLDDAKKIEAALNDRGGD